MTDEQSMYGVETNPEATSTAFWVAARRVRAKLLSRLKNDRAPLVSTEEDRRPLGGSMPAVENLLILLIEDSHNIAARMAGAGFSEEEIRGAWNFARQAGYVEATGLGQDRLTEVGRARAREIGTVE